MVDAAVMLGANKQDAEAQMKPVLDFEIKLAQVSTKTLEKPNSFKSLTLRKKIVLSRYLMLQWSVCSFVDCDPL